MLLPLGVHAQDATWIESIAGDPAGIVIERAGERRAAQLFMGLEQGDIVHAAPGSSLVVHRHSGDSLRLDSSSTPYTVSATPQEGATVTANLVDWAGVWLTGWYAETAEQRTALAMSRGDSPYLASPLLQADVHFLVLPKTDLCVSWSGGTAPFDLVLTTTAGKAIGAHRSQDGRAACVPAVELAPGPAHLVVRDAAGEALRIEIEALDRQADPAAGEALVPATTDPRLATVVESAWIAAEGGEQWWLEAYQRLVPIAADFDPAAQLMQALSQGRVPARP